MATATVALGSPFALEAVSGDTAIQYHAADLRQLIGATFPRYGRLGLGDALWLYPNASGANWSVDVQAGWFICAPPTNPSYAAERYLITVPTRTTLWLDGTHTQPLFNLAPSSLRTHKVWAVLNDKNLSGSTYGASLVVTEDTGSGAPNPSGTNFAQIGTVTIAPAQANIGSANLSTTLARASQATLTTAVTYLNSNIAGDGSGGPGVTYSVNGNTVRFQGNLKPGSGTYAVGNSYVVANVAVGYRPAYTRILLAGSSGPTIARVIVGSTGDVTVTPYSANLSAMTYCCFDGLNYEIF